MADLRTLALYKPPGAMDAPVTLRDLMALQDNVRASVDPLVKLLTQTTGAVNAIDPSLYQLLSEKAAADGYADLDSSAQVPNARIKWDAPSAIGGTTPAAGTFAALVALTLALTTAVPASPAANTMYQGAGGPHKILSQTASSSSSLDFTTNFDSRYLFRLYFLAGVRPATDGDAFWVRAMTGAPAAAVSTGTPYTYGARGLTEGGGSADLNSTGANQIVISSNVGNATTKSLNGLILLTNWTSGALHKSIIWLVETVGSAGSLSVESGAARYAATTAVTGLQARFSSGNIAEGTISEYGFINA